MREGQTMPQHTCFDSATPPTFFATVGADVIEHAEQLPVLLSILCEIWEAGFGADLCVWQYPARLLEVWTCDGRRLALRQALAVPGDDGPRAA
jgi:hypothetical protein